MALVGVELNFQQVCEIVSAFEGIALFVVKAKEAVEDETFQEVEEKFINMLC